MTEALIVVPPPTKTSASQLDTFYGCERKWAWRSIDGIAQGANRFADLGTMVHTVLEGWLIKGVAPDPLTEVGRIAAAGIQYLPLPRTGVVEGEFSLPARVPGIIWHGRVDWRGPGVRTKRRIIDHKTTTDIGSWAKSVDDLRTDPQAVIYADVEMRRENVDEVEEDWIYYQTRGPAKSRKVSLVVTRTQIDESLLMHEETALRMRSIRLSGARALDLEPNVKTCDAYGGCSYVDHCKLTVKERMKAIMAQGSLVEKLKNKAAGGTPAAAAPAAAPAAAAVAPAAAAAVVPAQPASVGGGINPPARTVAAAPEAAAAAPAAAAAAAPGSATSDLRDGFAMSALNGLIAARSPGDVMALAKLAYEYASAMVKAR